MTLDELKKGLGTYFYKDLSRIDPNARGIGIGENVRIYVDGEGYKVRFLLGMPPGSRQPILERLKRLNVAHTVGPDFKT